VPGHDYAITTSGEFIFFENVRSSGASTHCEFDRKYSSYGFKAAASIRNAMIDLRLDAERPTNRIGGFRILQGIADKDRCGGPDC
jgi:hypothetical protein